MDESSGEIYGRHRRTKYQMDDDCFDESLHESPIKTRYEVEQTMIAEKN